MKNPEKFTTVNSIKSQFCRAHTSSIHYVMLWRHARQLAIVASNFEDIHTKYDTLVRYALIHNTRSRKNRRDRGKFALEAKKLLGEAFFSPKSLDDIASAIAFMQAQGVETIIVNGGDGTVSDVMSAVSKIYPPDHLPDLAILPSGNTNLIAQDLGLSKRNVSLIKQLIFDKSALRRVVRRPLQIEWPNHAHPARLGMLFGLAGFARAISIAHSPHVLSYAPHNLALGVTVVGAFGSLVLKRHRETWLQGDLVKLSSPKAEIYDGHSFFFMATALKKFSMGIWPFWNEPGAYDKGFRYLNVQHHPKHLLSASLQLLRGSAPTWLQNCPDYTSGREERLHLTCDSAFVLDGEVYSAGPAKGVNLSLGPELGFLCD